MIHDLPRFVKIVEVVPRYGLQNEKKHSAKICKDWTGKEILNLTIIWWLFLITNIIDA
jgi:hypothetical protein